MRLWALLQGLIDGWALFGGMLLGAVVTINLASIIGALIQMPFAGDFELTQIGVANAAFAFLPYCQMRWCNVAAEIFTSRLGPRGIAGLNALASSIALGFALLLCWRMIDGLHDQYVYGYTSAIVQFPMWLAYVPATVSLFLLVLAAGTTLLQTTLDVLR